LKGKVQFSSIEVTWIIHATEDEEKVMKKIVSLFPLSIERIKSSKLWGHFRNPVILYKIKLSGADADEFAHILFSSLGVTDKKKLEYDLPKYVDKDGLLYFRISKQLLFENKIAISETDVMRIKLKPKSSFRPHDDDLSFYRGLLR